jgi:leucyl aminopeptidase
MHPAFLTRSGAAIPMDLVQPDDIGAWLKGEDAMIQGMCSAQGFRGEPGRVLMAPGADGKIRKVIAGLGDGRDGLVLAQVAASLPPGDYRIEALPDGLSRATLALGWADGAYRFNRYRKSEEPLRRLVLPKGVDTADVSRLAQAIDTLRDLVNTSAADLTPEGLAQAATDLAERHGAKVDIVTGRKLESGYPMVHAVGRAASAAPCYIELLWGREDAPRLALVGKGVTFDTGGLNLKTGSNMGLMKKDMGGAAHALALAGLVMDAGLDVRLSLHVPTVENAIGAGAFRPGDVLRSRLGPTVEIDDTDAEGRLILADALARACELKPELLIDFATLTGAARVALGPDLAPLYCNDDRLARDIESAAADVADPVWRMPLWAPYESGLKSSIADLKNTGDSPMAGSVTAALFLKQFVKGPAWAHFDIWAWRPARYGRPAGAAACGLRAVWEMLKRRYPG